jgi:shikimate 5-dehydrogenase
LLGLQKVQAKINDCDSVIILGSGGAAQSVLRSIALAKADRALMALIHGRSKEDLLDDLIYDQTG